MVHYDAFLQYVAKKLYDLFISQNKHSYFLPICQTDLNSYTDFLWTQHNLLAIDKTLEG